MQRRRNLICVVLISSDGLERSRFENHHEGDYFHREGADVHTDMGHDPSNLL